MFDGRWRGAVDRGTGPVGQKLHRMGVTADMLTATGLISATATAVAVGTGHLHLAIILLILTGLHDLLDGPVAKASGTSLGAGRLLRLGHRPGGRRADPRRRGLVPGVDPPRASRPAALRRARRHVAGLLPAGQGRVAGHLGQGRVDGAGRADDPARASASCPSVLLVPVLWVMLVLTMATAVGRFVKVWRLAEAPVPVAAVRRHRRTRSATRSGGRDHLGVAVALAGPAPGRAVQPVRSDLAGPACPSGHPAAHRTSSHLSRPGHRQIEDEGS